MEAETILENHGLTRAALLCEVETVYGRPKLVVITGSIAAGFGNETSDLDILVVVDSVDRVSQLPIMSYSSSRRFDTEYYTARDMFAHEKAIDAAWPSRSEITPTDWRSYYRTIRTCTRFSVGHVVDGSEDWIAWLEKLRSPAFHTAVQRWWQAEAVRVRTGARWLLERNPRLAAVRFGDSIMCALSAAAAGRGELFIGKKWLPQKLRRAGLARGCEIFTEFVRLPCNMKGILQYVNSARAALDELLPENDMPPDYQGELWEAEGVEKFQMARNTLVTRWGLRGVVLENTEMPPSMEGVRPRLLWRGPIEASPDPVALNLFLSDMACLSVSVGREGAAV